MDEEANVIANGAPFFIRRCFGKIHGFISRKALERLEVVVNESNFQSLDG